MATGGQCEVAGTHGLPVLRAAGGWRALYAGQVHAIDFEVELDVAGRGWVGGDAERERITRRHWHLNGVFEPLARVDPADVVTAAGVGRVLNVHAIAAILATRIARGRVVIGKTIAPHIVVLGLDYGG